jgi:hypothetical protein
LYAASSKACQGFDQISGVCLQTKQ